MIARDMRREITAKEPVIQPNRSVVCRSFWSGDGFGGVPHRETRYAAGIMAAARVVGLSKLIFAFEVEVAALGFLDPYMLRWSRECG